MDAEPVTPDASLVDKVQRSLPPHLFDQLVSDVENKSPTSTKPRNRYLLSSIATYPKLTSPTPIRNPVLLTATMITALHHTHKKLAKHEPT